MKTSNLFFATFLSLIMCCQIFSCTKEEKKEIKDNLIVGTWSANSEINRIFVNLKATLDTTKKYEKNDYLMTFQSDNTMWVHLKGALDSTTGTYNIGGTQLYTSTQKGGLSYRDTFNFSASETSLKIYNTREKDSVGKQYRFDYELNLLRKE